MCPVLWRDLVHCPGQSFCCLAMSRCPSLLRMRSRLELNNRVCDDLKIWTSFANLSVRFEVNCCVRWIVLWISVNICEYLWISVNISEFWISGIFLLDISVNDPKFSWPLKIHMALPPHHDGPPHQANSAKANRLFCPPLRNFTGCNARSPWRPKRPRYFRAWKGYHGAVPRQGGVWSCWSHPLMLFNMTHFVWKKRIGGWKTMKDLNLLQFQWFNMIQSSATVFIVEKKYVPFLCSLSTGIAQSNSSVEATQNPVGL